MTSAATSPLQQFANACHDALKADPGPKGRRQICALLADVLKDDNFIAAHLRDDTAERHMLYEDPELGFCILAHVYHDPKASQPHDHAHSWAIYGQGRGETHMTDWEKIEPASANKPGKVRSSRTYTLKPGMLRLYNEGDLHSPRRDGPTRLIRIEGTNMEKVKRFEYKAVAED